MSELKTSKEQSTGFHDLSRRQLVWTIVGLQMTLLLAAIDQTIVSTAMPSIVAQLNGFDRYAWVTTAYMLSSTTCVPIFGKLSDIYGRKYILMFGVILFVLSSALCGLSGEIPYLFGGGMNQLIVFRGLQGVAGGVIMALTFTVIGDLFPPAERGKYQGLFAAVWGLASVIGPTLGGWITDHWTWRWVFYVNMPVGLLASVVLYRSFPHFHQQFRKHSLDVGGLATLIGFLVPLLIGLTWAAQQGWHSAAVLSMFASSAVMFCLFMYCELRAGEPIVSLSLFRDPVIAISFASLLLMSMTMFGGIMFVPLFMQSVLGLSPTRSGSFMIAMTVSISCGSIICGQITSRLGRYKLPALIGFALVSCGFFFMSGLDARTSNFECIRDLIMVGFGLGLLMPVYTIAVQNVVPREKLGAATGMTQFFRSIGGTLGAAVFGTVLLANYTEHLKKLLPPGLPAQTAHILENPLKLNFAQPAVSASLCRLGPQLAGTLIGNVKHSLVQAVDGIYLASFLITIGAFVLNLFLKEVPLRRTHHFPPAGGSGGQDPAAAQKALID